MRVLACLVPLFLAGCFISRTTVNEPLPPGPIEALRPGETTAADVLRLFGAPTEVVQLGRRTAYRFDASTSKRAGLLLLLVVLMNDDTRSDRIWVFFDENDVLTHVGATFDSHDPVYAMPWQKIHGE
ncbi:MAG: hypothetical protein AB1726_02265 [Planctomycetota bacterium]